MADKASITDTVDMMESDFMRLMFAANIYDEIEFDFNWGYDLEENLGEGYIPVSRFEVYDQLAFDATNVVEDVLGDGHPAFKVGTELYELLGRINGANEERIVATKAIYERIEFLASKANVLVSSEMYERFGK